MANNVFSVRAASDSDFEDGVQYSGASMGIISPGGIAMEVLGAEISFGRLFAYCVRRFGFPNCGSDPYKEIASYTLVTPMNGVFLTVNIKATTSTSLMFGYIMPLSLDHELCIENRAVVEEFHAQFLAWRQKNGLSLPRDLVKEIDDAPGRSNSFDHREDMRQFDVLLKQYCADGGLHYDEMPKGPKTMAVLDAIRATLETLKMPIGVRDCYFSATSDSCDVADSDDEEDDDENTVVATAHPSAGYFIPPDYMADPKLFVALSEKLIHFGGGTLANGIAAFVANA